MLYNKISKLYNNNKTVNPLNLKSRNKTEIKQRNICIQGFLCVCVCVCVCVFQVLLF